MNKFISTLHTIVAATEEGSELKISDFNISMSEIDKSKFSEAWNIYKKTGCCLYRGVRHNLPEISVMTPGFRKSQNTDNYYTWMVSDFFDSWKEFPPRNHSFICSTSRAYAQIYGTVYCIFPENGVKLGVCPVADIWGSFNNLFKVFQIEEMPQFNVVIRKMLRKKNLEKTLSKDEFEHFLKTTTGTEIYQLIQNQNKNDLDSYLDPNKYGKILGTWDKSLFELFENLMNPKKNKFQLMDLEQLFSRKGAISREVWFDADCLTIERSLAEELRESSNQQS